MVEVSDFNRLALTSFILSFNDLAKRFENRKGGYTRILKLTERRGDDALMVILELVEKAPVKEDK